MKRFAPHIILTAVIAALLAFGLLRIGRSADGGLYQPEGFDGAAMLQLTEALSSDALEGRAVGTPGAESARQLIIERFESLGLEPWGDEYRGDPFPVLANESTGCAPSAVDRRGVNLTGLITGRTSGDGPLLLVMAHFDHCGTVGGEIYNGADDNASGAAALTAIAEHFIANPPEHDILIAALDAEENGLLGARALLASLPEDRAVFAVNLDMVSRSEAGELCAAGAYHTPRLGPLIDRVAQDAPVTLLKGHDSPDLGPNDWTLQSDHAVFHRAGLPFLYFGVEDHPGYHDPSDDYDAITHDFFLRAVETIILVVDALDAELEDHAQLRK